MAYDLADFLISLATDPGLSGEFRRDPGGLLSASGVPSDFRDAVRERDAGRLRVALHSERTGRLTIAGMGMRPGHLTLQSRLAIQEADRVVYLLADTVMVEWVLGLNPHAESLEGCFSPGDPSQAECDEIIGRVLSLVRRGLGVCAVFHGHPGYANVLAGLMLRRAWGEDLPAAMLPAVSVEDCLFAEVGIDPGKYGCQSHDASDFIARRRRFDPCTALLLFGLNALGEGGDSPVHPPATLHALGEILLAHYGVGHEVVVHETSLDSATPPETRRVPLGSLPEVRARRHAILFVPPLMQKPMDPAMLRRLGFDTDAREI